MPNGMIGFVLEGYLGWLLVESSLRTRAIIGWLEVTVPGRF